MLNAAAAEQAILGSVLLRAVAVDEAIEAGLSVDDFGDHRHRVVWEAMESLRAEDSPIDLVTLPERIGDGFDRVGGYLELANLSQAAPSTKRVAHYTKIVRNASLRRSVASLAEEVRHITEQSEHSAEDCLALLEQRVGELRQRARVSKDWRHIGDVTEDAYNALYERSKAPSTVVGVPTGLADVDEVLTGLKGGDLVILAARPAMGKTALALGIAFAAAKAGFGTALFELEMADEQLGARSLSHEARIDSHRMRTGRMKNDDWAPMMAAVEDCSRLPIWVDDSPTLTPAILRAKLGRLASRQPIGLAIIDYIQLMRGDGKFNSRENEVSSISRELKLIAKSMNIPVLCLAQLNRNCEGRADKRPMLSDLRESGAIEQDADAVMFLYRGEVYQETPDNRGLAEVLIRKQRNGSTGEVKVAWIKEHTRFANLERKECWGRREYPDA